jgi:hypothetical protein
MSREGYHIEGIVMAEVMMQVSQCSNHVRVWHLTYVSVQNHYNIYQRICIVSYILVFVLLYRLR